jgi:hypothetical protein
MSDVLLIATSTNPLSTDYAEHCRRQGRITAVQPATSERVAGLVIFLDRRATHEAFNALLETTSLTHIPCVCIVSSFTVHFGDRRLAELEERARKAYAGSAARVVVLRPSHVRSGGALMATWLTALPERWRSCCLEERVLFDVIDRELDEVRGPRQRIFTLLGPNRPWRELAKQRGPVAAVARLLMCCIAPLLALAFSFLAKRRPWLRAWCFDTLYPESCGELLALYNKYSHGDVKLVGYNNGVVHFGQHFPGKTIVSTIRTARRPRIGTNLAKVDAGLTIHDAALALREAGKELHVLPNYSYVSLGTTYFVPIHGSACSYSTIGETIDKVVLYDPVQDRFIVAARHHPDFSRYMYNLHAEVLLLRLYIRIKDRSQYFVERQELVGPSSADVVRLFHDDRAANVELRKSDARSPKVKVSKYYAEAPGGDGGALEVPRDALGSLWDRLEENRVTSTLFHGLTRRLAHHVELFLSEREFAVFWDTHAGLPIKKIQLRYIKRDGFPNSPFQNEDCISADLFMLKKHRGAFEAYLKETFGKVRMNPGKHSM